MADSTSTLQILLQLKDDASAAISGMGANTSSTFDSIAASAQKVGIAMIAAGTAITGFLGLAVAAAMKDQTATASLDTTLQAMQQTAQNDIANKTASAAQTVVLTTKQSLLEAEIKKTQDAIDKASVSHGAYTTAVKLTAAQQDAHNASLLTAQAHLKTYTDNLKNATVGTGDHAAKLATAQAQIASTNAAIEKLGEAHTKTTKAVSANTDTIAIDTAKLQTYKDQLAAVNLKLDDQKSKLQFATANLQDYQNQINAAAKANTDLGFTEEETKSSINTLLPIFGDVTESIKMNSIAMDLSRKSGMDLTESSKLVGLAYEGNGKALRTYGIIIKDQATPLEAINELQDQLAGQAVAYSKTNAGAMAIIRADQDKMMVQIGDQLLPIILQLTTKLSDIITKIQNWADAHPALFRAIVEATAAIGLLLIPIGTLLTMLPAIATGVGIVGTAFTALAANPIVLVIAALVALGLEIKAIVDAWQSLKDMAKQAADEMQSSADLADKANKQLASGLLTAQQAAKLQATTAQQQQASAAFQQSTSVGGMIKNGLSTLGNSTVGDLFTQFASGGIVNSPTLAMVGEAGPEAIIPLSAFNKGTSLAGAGGGGSGGNIVVNINGGNYLDQNAGRMFGNLIAREINRNLKLRTT